MDCTHCSYQASYSLMEAVVGASAAKGNFVPQSGNRKGPEKSGPFKSNFPIDQSSERSTSSRSKISITSSGRMSS